MARERRLFVHGAPADPAALAHQALVNYGAYTSFRFEDGGTRGLSLHLARLQAAADELFGAAIDEAQVRAEVRQALGARDAAFVRISLFSRQIGHRDPTWVGAPEVMIGIFDPPPPLGDRPLRVRSFVYQRDVPHLKSVATLGLMRARRAVRAAGADDALFVDASGRVSEGTLWNIGFVSGDTVVWPEAPMLAGVTQALLTARLAGQGLSCETRQIHLDEVGAFDGAFLCNSATPACPIAEIDAVPFDTRAETLAGLRAAWASNPVETI